MSDNSNLGKVLQRNDDPQEPVFEPVAALPQTDCVP